MAVVSDSFVRRHWPGENPLGRRFKFGFHDRTVVGVVGDIKVRGLEASSEPQVYLSYQQADDGEIIGYVPKDLVVRTSEPLNRMLPAVREIVARADSADSDLRRPAARGDRGGGDRAAARPGAGPRRASRRSRSCSRASASTACWRSRCRSACARSACGSRWARSRATSSGMVLRQGAILAGFGVVAGRRRRLRRGPGHAGAARRGQPGGRRDLRGGGRLAGAMALLGSLLPALRAVRVDPMTVIRAE